MSSDLRVWQVLCPDFTLALCLPIDGIVRNFFCFSFYWEFTRHTTFLVVSGSTFLPPTNVRIEANRPFVNFVSKHKISRGEEDVRRS